MAALGHPVHFLLLSHTTPPDGSWGLDDLAGSAGRVDVLCRAVTNALFVSHGISKNVVTLQFQLDPPTAVRIDGAKVRRMNPDERSTAARIRNALQARHDDPWWEEVEPGIEVAPYTFAETLAELNAVILLDAGGDPATRPVPDGTYALSDHQHFTDAERALLQPKLSATMSLGKQWLHGHQCIIIINWLHE